MLQSLRPSLVDLLDDPTLSDTEIRRLIGWQALSLIDLLQRKCITVRYAEQALFNLDVIQRLEQRHLKDCVELMDWGMQLEDWEEHTPEQLPGALTTLAELAQRLLSASFIQRAASTKRSRLKQRHTTFRLMRDP
jgi:hypothetical protein